MCSGLHNIVYCLERKEKSGKESKDGMGGDFSELSVSCTRGSTAQWSGLRRGLWTQYYNFLISEGRGMRSIGSWYMMLTRGWELYILLMAIENGVQLTMPALMQTWSLETIVNLKDKEVKVTNPGRGHGTNEDGTGRDEHWRTSSIFLYSCW